VRLPVRTTPEADGQIREIDSWGAETVLLHQTCSLTNSRQRSTSSATHHKSDACIDNLPYRIRVVPYSRELAITSTMSRALTR